MDDRKEILAKQSKCIYHIEDMKSGYVVSTFLSNSQAEAQRSFDAELKNEESMLSKYPEDYKLVYDGIVEHTTILQDMSVLNQINLVKHFNI